jgi:heterokaryon incompatibility protein (HET)
MALYNYRPLNIEAGEIRLLDILPGLGEDPLRAHFLDAHVPIPDEPMQTYIDDPEVAKLQNTMPADWEAARTVGGQLIFIFKDDKSTSWSHPNPEYALTPEPVPTNRKVLPKDVPSYEALSYCWGLAEPSELLTIHLDSELGFTQRGVISIRPNLASALRHLRYPSSARRIWIDALCINQTDIIERGRHVARMGTIYEFASRVLIWLGPEADNSSVAMEQFQKLGNQVETVEGKLLPSPGSAHPEWMKSYDINREIFNSFKALLSRQYFSRLYTGAALTDSYGALPLRDARIKGTEYTRYSVFAIRSLLLKFARTIRLPFLKYIGTWLWHF